MSSLPVNWRIDQIGNLFKIGRGRVINKLEIDSNPGPYPVYSSQSTNNGEMGRIGTFDFEGNYITWTTDGAYAGTVFYRTGKFNCTNVCGTLLSINAKEISEEYGALAFSMVSKDHVSYVGNPKLMNNTVSEIEIIFPKDIKEQKKIAEILTSVDKVIELTEIEIKKLKNLKKGMMQDLLTKGIGHTKFKDSPIGKIPESWECARFDSFIILQRGHDLPVQDRIEGDFPIMGSNGQVGSHNEFKAEGPGVVTGRSGSLGLVSYVEKDYWPLNTSLFVKDFKGNLEKYCYYFLQHFDLERFGTGTGVPTLNRNDVHSVKIAFPQKNEQLKIVNALDSVARSIEIKTSKFEHLKNIKKGLMQDLLTGKVRVKV